MKSSGAALAMLLCFGVEVQSMAAEPGFYAGGDIGVVAPTIEKSDGVSFFTPSGTRHLSPEAIRFDESELGWSALIGYRVNSFLAAELAYLDFGSIDVEESFDLSDDPADPQLTFVDFNSQVSGPMVSVMGLVPLPGNFEAFGRAGVLWARQEIQLARHFSFNDGEERWALGLGVQVELSRRWSGRLEYQRFEEIDGTVVSGELRLERIQLGTTYRFGARAASNRLAGTSADPVEKGFYAVADLGVTEPAVGKSDGFLISFTHVPGVIFRVQPSTSTADGSDAGGGVALGYRINRYLAAELAYTDFGEVDVREHYVVGPFDFPFFVPMFEIDVDLASRVAGPSLNVLGILPVADDFELFARAGVLFADHNVSRAPLGGATNSEELLIWGVGMDVELTRRWSVRFAYESLEDLRKTRYTGPVRIERFMVGASYDF